MSNGQKKLPLQRLSNTGIEIRKETVVEEFAIQLTALDKTGNVYCHTTLLATPMDLIELHMGHLYAEGYLDEVPSVDHFNHSFDTHHIVHYDSICSQPIRNGIVTSSCGACNHPDLLVDGITTDYDEHEQGNYSLDNIQTALDELTQHMVLFKESGGCHGSALRTQSGTVEFVAEDIGRHNAVDKTIGKALSSDYDSMSNSMLLLSGRCGWDIVAKAVRVGIPAIASFGAFSSAAVQLAREHQITLYGFVSNDGAWKVGY
ncbi:MAG: formate dehydrogenase accessory sulfurtransferase FdhD [Candidatus Poseidoniales archaeon]|nr:formate dehydrogenase accessory sulfurtransferase FdhD [Candidatus Poseidoniales archaeon]